MDGTKREEGFAKGGGVPLETGARGALVWLECGGLGSWLGGLLKLQWTATGDWGGTWVQTLGSLVGEVRPAARERWR